MLFVVVKGGIGGVDEIRMGLGEERRRG